ncbi:MAG: hypothetical protein H7A51_13780 [Akkermansiaceae bacterium]|nr:hypothetical protein [Akkermansiaceae bacterium]MCP5537286.1 hypothetical protein [Akkermansiaceae bacterium]
MPESFSTMLQLSWCLAFIGIFMVWVMVRIDGRYNRLHRRLQYCFMGLALVPVLGYSYLYWLDYVPKASDGTPASLPFWYAMLIPILPLMFGTLTRIGYRVFGHDNALTENVAEQGASSDR